MKLDLVCCFRSSFIDTEWMVCPTDSFWFHCFFAFYPTLVHLCKSLKWQLTTWLGSQVKIFLYVVLEAMNKSSSLVVPISFVQVLALKWWSFSCFVKDLNTQFKLGTFCNLMIFRCFHRFQLLFLILLNYSLLYKYFWCDM